MEKMKIFDFVKIYDQNKTFYAQVVTTNELVLNHGKSLQISSVKRLAKNNFLKELEGQ